MRFIKKIIHIIFSNMLKTNIVEEIWKGIEKKRAHTEHYLARFLQYMKS
jgi:hypothetical protein